MYRTQGSITSVATVRSAWFIVKEKQDPRIRLLLLEKNRLGDVTALAFRVDRAPGPGGTTVPAIALEKGLVTTTLEEALAPSEGGTQSELDRARDFLCSELAGPSVPAYQVQRGARANGIAEKT